MVVGGRGERKGGKQRRKEREQRKEEDKRGGVRMCEPERKNTDVG